jgi:hypothetical protein
MQATSNRGDVVQKLAGVANATVSYIARDPTECYDRVLQTRCVGGSFDSKFKMISAIETGRSASAHVAYSDCHGWSSQYRSPDLARSHIYRFQRGFVRQVHIILATKQLPSLGRHTRKM